MLVSNNEQKRIKEEKLHKKIWDLLNPGDSDYVEREVLYEFLKLGFDPYTPVDKIIPVVKELIGEC